MKKFISILFIFILSFSYTGYAEENIEVILDGKTLVFDQYPIIDNGRTLVPLRKIFEELGAEVQWDDETKTAVSVSSGISVQIQIDNTDMCINDEIKELDVPAKLINGRTLVPARAVSEAYGCDVKWNGETRTVIIKTEGYVQREAAFKTYTSEKYGYTVRYSDKYEIANADALGIKECDFVIKDSNSQASLTITAVENSAGALTITKEDMENALGVKFEHYEAMTQNGTPAVYYTFTMDGNAFIQAVYFTPSFAYTVTLMITPTADYEIMSDMAFTLISLNA